MAAHPSPSFASAPSSAPTPPHHRRLRMPSCMDLPCALPPSRGLRPRAFLGPQAHSPHRASQVRASAALYRPEVRYGGDYTTSQICDLPGVFSVSEVRYGGDYTRALPPHALLHGSAMRRLLWRRRGLFQLHLSSPPSLLLSHLTLARLDHMLLIWIHHLLVVAYHIPDRYYVLCYFLL